MAFRVKFHRSFVAEWRLLDAGVKEIVGEVLDHLEEEGPFLGRPEVDTLHGSRYSNMKEIRVIYRAQIWRFAFAFDPEQSAIILCGGAKQGVSKLLFYRTLIAKADDRFADWLKGDE